MCVGGWGDSRARMLVQAEEGRWSRGGTGGSVRVTHWAEPVCLPGVFMSPWPGSEEDQDQPWHQLQPCTLGQVVCREHLPNLAQVLLPHCKKTISPGFSPGRGWTGHLLGLNTGDR